MESSIVQPPLHYLIIIIGSTRPVNNASSQLMDDDTIVCMEFKQACGIQGLGAPTAGPCQWHRGIYGPSLDAPTKDDDAQHHLHQ